MSNASYKRSLDWLYGGNYTTEQVTEFNRIFSLFGGLAYLEQKEVFRVLMWLKRDDRVLCMEENEVLEHIYNRVRESQKEE